MLEEHPFAGLGFAYSFESPVSPWAKYQPSLYRASLHLRGISSEDAEQIVQESLQIAHEKMEAGDVAAPDYAWIRQLCIKLCYYRLQRRRPLAMDGADDGSEKERLAAHGDIGGSTGNHKARFKTLVVETSLGYDAGLLEFLAKEGHSVLRASSADEALTLAQQFEPDLVLLDNRIDGVGGAALLPEIMLEHSNAAVIMLASKPSVPDVVDAIKWGALDYLERPLDLTRLKRSIDVQMALFKGPLKN